MVRWFRSGAGRERTLTSGMWAAKPILYSKEPQAPRLRISIVRFSAQVLRHGAMVLLASYLFGQNAAPSPPLPSTKAISAAPPIDFKPDATGSVPAEQIRELLRRSEEKEQIGRASCRAR